MTADERRAVLADWKALREAPSPPDRRTIGCMTTLIALALAVLGPMLLKLAGIALPGPVKLALNAALILAFLGGLVFGVFFGSGRFGQAVAEAEAARDWLAAHGADPGDPERRRREAVRLLFHAYCSDGPTTASTIDFAATRERLGAALGHVVEVERVLRAGNLVYPVFTGADKPKLPG